MYFEDADSSMRLIKAGYQISICPHTIASHAYQHTSRKNELMQTTEAYFAKKWFPKVLRKMLLRLKHIQPPAFLYAPHSLSLSSLDELQNLLNGGELVAFSPSPWRIPAIWRHAEYRNITGLA